MPPATPQTRTLKGVEPQEGFGSYGSPSQSSAQARPNARPQLYDCEDCGQGWDYDFRPNDEAREDFGVLVCDRCAEKRFEREYLNSAESRADRQYDAGRE